MSDDRTDDISRHAGQPTRRELVAGGAAVPIAMGLASGAAAQTRPNAAPAPVSVSLTVNGARHTLALDPRSTLLDVLREHLDLTGTKKGCDQGTCGACTVLLNGRRILSCLTLAVMHDGAAIATSSTTAAIRKLAEIGRVTNTPASPWAIIRARRRFSSIIGPRMKPRIIGAGSQSSLRKR